MPATLSNIQTVTDTRVIRQVIESCALPTDDLGTVKNARFFAVHADTVPVATVGIETHDTCGLLRSLAVMPGHRKSGLGAALLQFAENYATNAGISQLYLLTSTAEKFFAGHGYQPIDRAVVPDAIRQTDQFASICPDSAAVMTKPL